MTRYGSTCPVTDLKNAAAHRENTFHFAHVYCWEQKLVAQIDVGLQYVQIPEDKQATAAIEDLQLDVLPRLIQRHVEWMGPSWPISKWYMAVYERIHDVQVTLGTIKVYQPSSEQFEAQRFPVLGRPSSVLKWFKIYSSSK
ncbi:MAG: hypothetical protein Q9212_005838 [Teloschistes hypoglaucus]